MEMVHEEIAKGGPPVPRNWVDHAAVKQIKWRKRHRSLGGNGSRRSRLRQLILYATTL